MERFGHFMIVRALQRGGMGKIHVAYNERADRVSVLKRNMDPEQEGRFRDEMTISARLTHPNFVKVLETGAVDGDPYIELEYLPGKNLEHLNRRASFIPPSIAIAIAEQVCAALEYAHGLDLKFIHRDISSGNVHVEYSGAAHLIDFGLSVSALKQYRTGHGLAPGTPGFASPEQLTRKPLDVRSDVYGLGAVLWYLLVGRPLYDLRTPLDKIVTLATSVRANRSELPSDLDGVVARALAWNPDDRFQSANEMRLALRALRDAPDDPQHALADFMAQYWPDGNAEFSDEIAEARRIARAAAGRQERNVSTIVIDRDAERTQRRRRILAGVASAIGIAGVILGVAWFRANRGHSAPRPTIEVLVPPIPVENRATAPTPAPPAILTDAAPVTTIQLPPVKASSPSSPDARSSPRNLSAAQAREWADAKREIAAKRYKIAEGTFERFAADPVTRPWGQLGFAELYFARHEYDAAITSSTRALASSGEGPIKIEALLLRAHAHLLKGSCEGAARDFKHVLRLDRTNHEAKAGLQQVVASNACKLDASAARIK